MHLLFRQNPHMPLDKLKSRAAFAAVVAASKLEEGFLSCLVHPLESRVC